MSAPSAHYRQTWEQSTAMWQALGLVFLVGFFDYITGYDISFFLFYAIPILYCVWYSERRATTLVVLMSAIVWWWADWKAGHPYFASSVQIWETVMRFFFFSFFAIGGTAMKQYRDSMEARIEDMRKMRELERDIVRIGEREQQRIGQDLHDGLCQFLAGVSCVAGVLRDDLSERYQPEADTAAELHDLTQQAIVRAREMARGIAPVHVDEAGLASGLEELAVNTARLHGIDREFEPEGEILVSDRQTSIHLYRIAQEAIANAIRHGRATLVRVALAVENDSLVLTVEDNGTGVPVATAKGMGMRTMHYRAGVLDGRIDFTRRSGGGTVVSCRAPIGDAPRRNSSHAG